MDIIVYNKNTWIEGDGILNNNENYGKDPDYSLKDGKPEIKIFS